MTVASILHTFNIHPVIGEDGTKFDPETEASTGLISYAQLLCQLTFNL